MPSKVRYNAVITPFHSHFPHKHKQTFYTHWNKKNRPRSYQLTTKIYFLINFYFISNVESVSSNLPFRLLVTRTVLSL